MAKSTFDFVQFFDDLLEKRTATREKAWENVFRHMCLNYTNLEHNQEPLYEQLRKFINKPGSLKEKDLALDTLTVFSVTIGEDCSPYLAEEQSYLTPLIKSPDAAESSRASAVKALTVGLYLGGGEDDTLRHMDVLSSFISDDPSGLLAPSAEKTTHFVEIESPEDQVNTSHRPVSSKQSASSLVESSPASETIPPLVLSTVISYWSFLLTSLPNDLIVDTLVPNFLDPLAQLLDHDDLQVRLAAGEAITLLVDAQRHHNKEEIDLNPNKKSSGGSGGGKKKASVESVPEFDVYDLDGYTDVSNLIDRLTQLATGSMRYLTKKDKLSQRRGFREYLASITHDSQIAQSFEGVKDFEEHFEDDESSGADATSYEPYEKVKLASAYTQNKHSVVVEAVGWAQVKALNTFRECLGQHGGLDEHLNFNPTLIDIFNVQTDAHVPSDTLRRARYEQVLARAEKDKERTVDRKRQRRHIVVDE